MIKRINLNMAAQPLFYGVSKLVEDGAIAVFG
ncbi:hypothetical protein NIG5292_01803 [Nereida ignava]|uniref:Uncharacterized protein n=1 Tax=Nereida ignava TaxID=282199 RepID=A0A0U1NMN2_9RHOB|nr:hypothetical protein NIG5292_01803 [Nereida ignava]